jgi:hypothetical protein
MPAIVAFYFCDDSGCQLHHHLSRIECLGQNDLSVQTICTVADHFRAEDLSH